MSTQPCAAIKFREFDANGAPLAGGKLHTYAAGTTTPLATYTDASGTVANANPVVLDAAGRADVWLTPGLLYKFVLKDSSDVTQYTEDNFPAPASSGSTVSTTDVVPDPGGRLTLTNGTPVTTTDVTGANTIYYAPYKSSYVPLYDGTSWALYSIGSGLSQTTTDNTKSPAAAAINSNYDLFVWNDNGIIRLSRGPAWTSDTARGSGINTTELMQINGKWVNKYGITNGPGAQLGLWVGTVGTDASALLNKTESICYVWNQYNRVRQSIKIYEATASWSYSTATWRVARGSTTNIVYFLCGFAEDSIQANVFGSAIPTGGTFTASGRVAIGVDSTSTPNGLYNKTFMDNNTSFFGFYDGVPGLGRHYLAWLEWGQNIGSTGIDWYGTTNGQSGITGSWMS